MCELGALRNGNLSNKLNNAGPAAQHPTAVKCERHCERQAAARRRGRVHAQNKLSSL